MQFSFLYKLNICSSNKAAVPNPFRPISPLVLAQGSRFPPHTII